MKIRKSIIIIISLTMIFSLLVGCQGNDGENGEGNSVETEYLTVVTAPMGSGWHAVSVLLGDIWMNDVEGLNVSVLEGGSVGNIKAISEGIDANFGWAYTPDLIDAYEGRGSFEEKHEDALILGVMYPVWLNIVTLADSDIKTIDDLKDAKINAGAIGTGSEVVVQRLLEVYGLDYDKIKANGGTVSFGNYSDASTQLKDGIVDVMLGGGAPDIPAVHEVEAQQKIRLVPVDEEGLNKIKDKGYGYAVDLPIPADTYLEQTEEVPAVAYPSLMIVNKEVSEDIVYQVTKSLWENIETVRKEQPARGKYMQIETVFSGIDTENLHPGAAKYYKEIGILE
ncbi:MAG: TAXI family TRAP transporter solute-binding subunit [Bacillota bacterium]|nr:TAXI family TRAP transporter solute-binding subunit [Bacillota bacterium]